MSKSPQSSIEKNYPLGIVANGSALLVYELSEKSDKKRSAAPIRFKDYSFTKLSKTPQIFNNGIALDITKSQNFRMSEQGDEHILSYVMKDNQEKQLSLARSKDLVNWDYITELENVHESGMLVPNYKYKNQYVLFYGEHTIKVALSEDLVDWRVRNIAVLSPRKEYFDREELGVTGVLLTEDGILLIYHTRTQVGGYHVYSLGACLFDSKNPTRLMWQLDHPLWYEPDEWLGKKVRPLGLISAKGDILSFWYLEETNTIYAITHSLFKDVIHPMQQGSYLLLKKHKHNPILKPVTHHWWESQAVFNPAAFYDEEKVHLLYRAVGDQYMSVLGYAQSEDGVNITNRLNYPVYIPREPFEGVHGIPDIKSPFISGIGYGGCEDPRLTRIGNKLYLTYVAFNGWSPPRVALSSISVDDFVHHRWNWSTPVLISKPGVVDKNAVIFPEKINGKYVIFHRVFPNILVDFVDNLDFNGRTFLKGEYTINASGNSWDSRKIGAGPPPLKTKEGWLLIYHAVDERDDSRYKMGAMLLDYNDPTKVLARTKKPILEPNQWYENQGHKFGVAYPCGATVINDNLNVYYGGADTVVCVASTNINEFVNELQNHGSSRFSYTAI